MPEDQRGGIGEGIRTGFAILTAFKEAIEETLEDAVERGDLDPARASSAMHDVAERMQASFEETRERFDFVSRREFESLRVEVEALRAELAALRGGGQEAPGTTPRNDHDRGGGR